MKKLRGINVSLRVNTVVEVNNKYTRPMSLSDRYFYHG
jgi:hypothetical protein